VFKVPGVSARFGTDPFIWNWAMWLVRASGRARGKLTDDGCRVDLDLGHVAGEGKGKGMVNGCRV